MLNQKQLKNSVFFYTLEELAEQMISLGLKKHNAQQIFQWIYQKQANSFEQMSNIARNSIPILNEHFRFNKPKLLKCLIDPVDETTKFLFELEDGEIIETVLMKFNYGYSICVSTQIGCNMGCAFCASGLLKKIRNLTPDEIVYQYVYVNNYLASEKNAKISNMVIMGIGEPFDNYDNLIKAITIINNPYGIGLGNRHITVSTCGLVDKIVQFANDLPQVNLAISLHASNNEIRNSLMPINKRYNIETLLTTLKEYVKLTSRRITFEYILLDGINDSIESSKELVKLLRGILCYVNIIVYNSVSEYKLKPSKRAREFMEYLNNRGIVCTIRQEKGTKIAAACGQLRAKHEKK